MAHALLVLPELKSLSASANFFLTLLPPPEEDFLLLLDLELDDFLFELVPDFVVEAFDSVFLATAVSAALGSSFSGVASAWALSSALSGAMP